MFVQRYLLLLLVLVLCDCLLSSLDTLCTVVGRMKATGPLHACTYIGTIVGVGVMRVTSHTLYASWLVHDMWNRYARKLFHILSILKRTCIYIYIYEYNYLFYLNLYIYIILKYLMNI